MTKRKLPPAADWRARDIGKWNTVSFREYLKDTHTEKYGIPYITRSYAMEARLLKTMIDEYGAEMTKTFIDTCFSEYKPTQQYPGVNFAFMYMYMRERTLLRLLAEKKRDEERKEREQTANDGMTAEQLADWF